MVTDKTVALKPVVEARGETVTEFGIVTAALLLDKLTFSLPLVGPFRYTEQASTPGNEKRVLPQETALSCGTTLPKAVIDKEQRMRTITAEQLVRVEPDRRPRFF